MSQCNYREEFPDFELDVTIPEGFEDSSWHNDVCPSWYSEELDAELWVDYKNPEDREMAGCPRFLVVLDPQCERHIRLHTDDYAQVLMELDVLRSELNAKSTRKDN